MQSFVEEPPPASHLFVFHSFPSHPFQSLLNHGVFKVFVFCLTVMNITTATQNPPVLQTT